MNMLLHKGIVKVGTKLIIYNAELIGAGEGIDPLDVNILFLQINNNTYFFFNKIINSEIIFFVILKYSPYRFTYDFCG
jgi:hypothetical protein